MLLWHHEFHSNCNTCTVNCYPLISLTPDISTLSLPWRKRHSTVCRYGGTFAEQTKASGEGWKWTLLDALTALFFLFAGQNYEHLCIEKCVCYCNEVPDTWHTCLVYAPALLFFSSLLMCICITVLVCGCRLQVCSVAQLNYKSSSFWFWPAG